MSKVHSTCQLRTFSAGHAGNWIRDLLHAKQVSYGPSIWNSGLSPTSHPHHPLPWFCPANSLLRWGALAAAKSKEPFFYCPPPRLSPFTSLHLPARKTPNHQPHPCPHQVPCNEVFCSVTFVSCCASHPLLSVWLISFPAHPVLCKSPCDPAARW